MHLELDISANADCADIMLEVYINDTNIFQTTAQQKIQTVIYDISDEPGIQELKLVMNGKNSKHTKVDNEGKIISDIFFTIDRLEFEELDMKELFCLGRRSRYRHSFNSTQPAFDDEFYGDIGCNGTVFMPFSTPIYLWLFENLEQ
jgi:hypothetical protein